MASRATQPRRALAVCGTSPPRPPIFGAKEFSCPNCPSNTTTRRPRPAAAPSGMPAATGTPNPRPVPVRRTANRSSRSSSRRPTSPARCTSATPSTTACRTCSSARGGCRGTSRSGCLAPTMPASPRRPSSSGGCSKRKNSPATIWGARNSWSGSGPGRSSTKSGSSGSSATWGRAAIGTGCGSRSMTNVRPLSARLFSGSSRRALSAVVSGSSIGTRSCRPPSATTRCFTKR